LLRGGAGADVHDGGSGIEEASCSDASTGVTADLQTVANNTGIAAAIPTSRSST
jgi:hypothetical protein